MGLVGKVPKRVVPKPIPAQQIPVHPEYPPRGGEPKGVYTPVEFTHARVLAQDETRHPQGWADEPDVLATRKRRELSTLTGLPLKFTKHGRPVNPVERTGYTGRGLLGRWGANQAADPIVTSKDPQTGALQMLAILRKHGSRQWAIPGGMVDKGESARAAAMRELKEEVAVDVDFKKARVLYEGYAHDQRNTDNAWLETTVLHVHLSPAQARQMKPKAGDDAAAWQWLPLDEAHIATLYGSHAKFARQVVEQTKGKSDRPWQLR